MMQFSHLYPLIRTLSESPDYFLFFNLLLCLLLSHSSSARDRWRHSAWLPVFLLHKPQGQCCRETQILVKDESSLASFNWVAAWLPAHSTSDAAVSWPRGAAVNECDGFYFYITSSDSVFFTSLWCSCLFTPFIPFWLCMQRKDETAGDAASLRWWCCIRGELFLYQTVSGLMLLTGGTVQSLIRRAEMSWYIQGAHHRCDLVTAWLSSTAPTGPWSHHF